MVIRSILANIFDVLTGGTEDGYVVDRAAEWIRYEVHVVIIWIVWILKAWK